MLSAAVFWDRSSTEDRFKSTVDWSSQGCPNLKVNPIDLNTSS